MNKPNINKPWQQYLKQLGIEPTHMCEKQQIASQYRSLARDKHPDKCKTCTDKDMSNINEAKSALYDNYDTFKQTSINDIVIESNQHLGVTNKDDIVNNLELFGTILYAFSEDN